MTWDGAGKASSVIRATQIPDTGHLVMVKNAEQPRLRDDGEIGTSCVARRRPPVRVNPPVLLNPQHLVPPLLPAKTERPPVGVGFHSNFNRRLKKTRHGIARLNRDVSTPRRRRNEDVSTQRRKGAKAQRGRKAEGAREAAKSAEGKRERNTVAR